MFPTRASGILLHPSSLPGPFGSGDFGAAAYHFVDWLAAAGQSLWQILPLSPTGPGHSPYMSPSAFAIDPSFVDLQALVDECLLDRDALAGHAFDARRVDHATVNAFRLARLREAARNFLAREPAPDPERPAEGIDPDFDAFRAAQRDWLDDYALFMAIAERRPQARWQQWVRPLAQRSPTALPKVRSAYADDIAFWQFVQWKAARQWTRLKLYANERGVRVVGDLPIFVAPSGVDTWAHRALFDLDDAGEPRVIAGVPPDYFSATGQRWGNPLYRWTHHRDDGFSWWIRRVQAAMMQADVVRIDHFRGFAAHWEVPADAPDATGGRWVEGPGDALFAALRDALGTLPIIAEDLGVITDDVTRLRERFELPGMRVLQFAFSGGSSNAYLPHNHTRDSVVYTGTHDNDTSLGWFAGAPEHERRFAQTYLKTDGAQIGWDLIHAASQSPASMAIYPMQDVLGLGSEARMNRPGEPEGNWAWRFEWPEVADWHARRLREISSAHGRNGLGWPPSAG